MRRLAPLYPIALAIAFGAVTSTARGEDGQPAILLLSGNVTELKGEAKGGKSTLVLLPGGSENTLEASSVTLTINGCKALEGKVLDTSSCEGLMTFSGIKGSGVTCRSETLAGLKDALETVLSKVSLHLAAEKSTKGVLQPLAVLKVLGIDGDTSVIKVCGGLKIAEQGSFGCLLLPGLTMIPAGNKFEILCEVSGTGDPITGTCEQTEKTCKEYEADPFGWLVKESIADEWLSIRLEGTFNKDVFIDD